MPASSNPSSSTFDLRHTPIDDASRTQILVLGTPHLSGLGDRFRPELLTTLLGRLSTYRPDVIGVEVLSPAAVTEIEARDAAYREAVAVFADRIAQYGHLAREAAKTTRADASAVARELQGRLGETHDAVEITRLRRRLALHFLAAYELPSATLQWAYVPPSGRRTDEIIPEPVAGFLNRSLACSGEDVSIGVELAKRLGLQRVEAIDDQTDADPILPRFEQLTSELEVHPLSHEPKPIYAESERRLTAAVKSGDLWPAFEFFNSPAYARGDVEAQWHLLLRTRLPSGLDRTRAATWEVRNLNIASNIRKAIALHPGGRALVIIGAAHKAFLDLYLSQMMDTRIVQLAEIAPGT